MSSIGHDPTQIGCIGHGWFVLVFEYESVFLIHAGSAVMLVYKLSVIIIITESLYTRV